MEQDQSSSQNDEAPNDAGREQDLDASAILKTKTKTFKINRHFIPEWDGHVYIKTLTGRERDAFEASLIKEVPRDDGEGTKEIQTTENVRAKLLIWTLCDKDGKQLFSMEQADALGDLPANGLTRAYNLSSKVNAMSDADVKDLAKNSGRGASVTG
jgi:hypothetical protein